MIDKEYGPEEMLAVARSVACLEAYQKSLIVIFKELKNNPTAEFVTLILEEFCPYVREHVWKMLSDKGYIIKPLRYAPGMNGRREISGWIKQTEGVYR